MQINCLVLKNTSFKPRSYTIWTIDRTAHVGTISTPLCSCNRQSWGSQIEDGRALWNQTTQNCKSFQLICLVVELLCLVDSKFYTDLKNSSVYHVSILISRWLKEEVLYVAKVVFFWAYDKVADSSTAKSYTSTIIPKCRVKCTWCICHKNNCRLCYCLQIYGTWSASVFDLLVVIIARKRDKRHEQITPRNYLV